MINYGISDGYLLQQGITKGNDKIYAGKVTTFLGATKSTSPIAKSQAKDLPPIGDSFMYIRTSSIKYVEKDFDSIERTDIIWKSNITFHFSRFSAGKRNQCQDIGFNSYYLMGNGNEKRKLMKMITTVRHQINGFH